MTHLLFNEKYPNVGNIDEIFSILVSYQRPEFSSKRFLPPSDKTERALSHESFLSIASGLVKAFIVTALPRISHGYCVDFQQLVNIRRIKLDLFLPEIILNVHRRPADLTASGASRRSSCPKGAYLRRCRSEAPRPAMASRFAPRRHGNLGW
jgi:hypothetical protein